MRRYESTVLVTAMAILSSCILCGCSKENESESTAQTQETVATQAMAILETVVQETEQETESAFESELELYEDILQHPKNYSEIWQKYTGSIEYSIIDINHDERYELIIVEPIDISSHVIQQFTIVMPNLNELEYISPDESNMMNYYTFYDTGVMKTTTAAGNFTVRFYYDTKDGSYWLSEMTSEDEMQHVWLGDVNAEEYTEPESYLFEGESAEKKLAELTAGTELDIPFYAYDLQHPEDITSLSIVEDIDSIRQTWDKFLQENRNHLGTSSNEYAILYIDDDDSPEILVHSDEPEPGVNNLYTIGTEYAYYVMQFDEGLGIRFSGYSEKENLFWTDEGSGDGWGSTFYRLEDGLPVKLDCFLAISGGEQMHFYLNDIEVSESEFSQKYNAYPHDSSSDYTFLSHSEFQNQITKLLPSQPNNTSNTTNHSSDDGWKDAYLQVIDELTAQMTKYTAPYEGALMYIDDDNIPEMYFCTNMNPGEVYGGIYTYQNGEAVLVHEVSNREFYYGHKEKNGEFATHGWNTDSEYMTFFTMNGTTRKENNKFICNVDTTAHSYTVNGNDYSESEYTNKRSAEEDGFICAEIVDADKLKAKISTEEISTAPQISTISGTAETKYLICTDAVTWDEAERLCEQRGGHLAYIKTKADYDAIISALDTTKLRYLWVGGTSKQAGGVCIGKWTDGSSMTYINENNLWFNGEPSGYDPKASNYDYEPYIMLWNIKEQWSFNDNSDVALDTYKHEYFGYICEFDSASSGIEIE